MKARKMDDVVVQDLTPVCALDSLGKPKPIDTSGILPKTNLAGGKP